MLTEREFRRWIEFLAEQVLALSTLHAAATGERPRATPEIIAFLKMNNDMSGERIEEAVSEFANCKVWPAWLNGDQIVNLMHRVALAQGLLIMMQNGQLMHASALPVPKSKERAKFIRWLLLDLWRYGGVTYLEGLTNSYFTGDSASSTPFR